MFLHKHIHTDYWKSLSDEENSKNAVLLYGLGCFCEIVLAVFLDFWLFFFLNGWKVFGWASFFWDVSNSYSLLSACLSFLGLHTVTCLSSILISLEVLGWGNVDLYERDWTGVSGEFDGGISFRVDEAIGTELGPASLSLSESLSDPWTIVMWWAFSTSVVGGVHVPNKGLQYV